MEKALAILIKAQANPDTPTDFYPLINSHMHSRPNPLEEKFNNVVIPTLPLKRELTPQELVGFWNTSEQSPGVFVVTGQKPDVLYMDEEGTLQDWTKTYNLEWLHQSIRAGHLVANQRMLPNCAPVLRHTPLDVPAPSQPVRSFISDLSTLGAAKQLKRLVDKSPSKTLIHDKDVTGG